MYIADGGFHRLRTSYVKIGATSMTPTIKTIPDILIEVRGNQSEAARQLACSRNTILRYSRDTKAQFHAIVNGVLMVHQGGRGKTCAA